MIPKIIHYCWFGNGKKPKELQFYMDSWRKNMPDYTILEWNESNFDIQNSIPYVKEAYSAKKYAFVSDYVRLYVLYEYGGIYLDTDIELLKSPEDLLRNAALVTGFESLDTLITAFIACEKGNIVIKKFLTEYQRLRFLKENGTFDLTPINNRFTQLLCEYGLKLDNTRQSLKTGIEIYPYTTFCGYDIRNSHPKISDSTYTIHHFQSSWKKMNIRTRIKYHMIVPVLQKLLGYDKYDKFIEGLHRK